MQKTKSLLWSFFVAVCLLLVLLAATGHAGGQTADPAPVPDEVDRERAATKMDEELLRQLRDAGEAEVVTAIVRLGGEANLSGAAVLSGRPARAAYTVQMLQRFAEVRQAGIRRYLDQAQKSGLVDRYHGYFIFNGLAVTARPAAIWQVALRDDVESVTADHVYHLDTGAAGQGNGGRMEGPNRLSLDTIRSVPSQTGQSVTTAEWNVSHINADDVWTLYGVTGDGVVVANIDSGVQYNHPALVNQYAGNLGGGTFDHDYHWFDATAGSPTPYDDNGHGTHTMGTLAGGDGPGPFADDIGVAPGARWLAVKAFTADGTATASQLHDAFQWILAPCPVGVTPGDAACDPARAPHAVNNSWGSRDGSRTEFLPDVVALRAAGIWPGFSAGNSGPGDASLSSPGSFAESFATGATDINDTIATFSSRGPSPLTDAVKPDVVAPGVDVRSSVPLRLQRLSRLPGNGYASLNGTSMASPHSVGLAALMLEAAPSLDLEQLESIIRDTAVDRGVAGPDMVYGYGRIDALKAVQRLIAAGQLAGTVRDDNSSASLPDVSLRAVGQGLDLTTSSDGGGNYQFDYLIEGPYTLTARVYGYQPLTLTDVIVVSDTTTTQDVAMTALPTVTISGHIYDAVSPTVPISDATVTVLDTPLAPVTSDDTGFYQIAAAEGAAVVEAAAFGYATGVTATTVTTDTALDFYLDPLPPILLVDDDEGRSRSYSPNVEEYYFSALDANGYSYDHWDVDLQGAPDFATVRQYAAVVWFGGEWGRIKDISEAAQAQALMDYLDLGGRLFYVSQAHTYYFGDDEACAPPGAGGAGPCPFTRSYLGAADWQRDQKAEVSYGVAGNPVGNGLGPIPMTVPPLFTDLSDDVTGTIEADLAFTATVAPDRINKTTHTVYSDTAGFKTVFMAMPLEAMSAADAADVTYAVMEWFGVSGLAEGVTLAPATQSRIAPAGETVTFTLRLRNLSPFADSFDLSLVEAPWPTTIWDATFDTPISQIGPVLPGETADIGLAVAVPAESAPGAEATSVIRAVSQSGTPYSVAASLTAQAKMDYHVRDSDTCGDGVAFAWVDALGGDRWQLEEDDPVLPEAVSVPLPQPFLFYNQPYDHVWFNDHATVLFGDDNLYNDGIPSLDPPLPNATILDPDNAIYLALGTSFWHPSREDPEAGVYTYHDTSNGRNRFVIEYYKYPNLRAGEPDEDTMEVILDLDTYEITVQYQTVTYSEEAVVGIENAAGSEGILYVNEQQPAQNVLHDGLAVHYGLGDAPDVVEVDIDPATAAGAGARGSAVDYVLTLFNASSVADSYTLEVSGNSWPVTLYDVAFTTPITILGPVPSCQPAQFGVRVQVPATADDAPDVATVRARSQADTLVVASSTLTTGQAKYAVFMPLVSR